MGDWLHAALELNDTLLETKLDALASSEYSALADTAGESVGLAAPDCEPLSHTLAVCASVMVGVARADDDADSLVVTAGDAVCPTVIVGVDASDGEIVPIAVRVDVPASDGRMPETLRRAEREAGGDAEKNEVKVTTSELVAASVAAGDGDTMLESDSVLDAAPDADVDPESESDAQDVGLAVSVFVSVRVGVLQSDVVRVKVAASVNECDGVDPLVVDNEAESVKIADGDAEIDAGDIKMVSDMDGAFA